MSHSCLIWADPRTGSSALFYALAKVMEGPALYEPFQYGRPPNSRLLAHIYEGWCIDGDPAALYRAVGGARLIKHIPEAFDDNFNADLARAAEYHGYRHIRLIRCDTFSRLVSRGIAEQLDAWSGPPEDITREDIKPIDVGHLVSDMRLDAARWRAVVPWLTAALMVRTEDLVSPYAMRRHLCISRMLRFLELPPGSRLAIEETLAYGRQDTMRVMPWVPNLDELRAALATEGAA